MRTTLKKGTRRSANGNGALPPGPLPLAEPPLRAPPPAPPPGDESGRSFYRVRRNPLKLLAKGVMWLVILVLVAAGALAGGVKLYFDHSVSEIRATSPEVKAAAIELAEAQGADKPAVAMIIGYDMRGSGSSSGWRSDTVMLVRIDPDKDAATLLSFPRDLYVTHPGCEGHPSWSGKLNEAFAFCGPKGTLTTVKELTGIPIHYMITVNFRAFTKIVDRLDGVYMDVDQRYFNDVPDAGYPMLDLNPDGVSVDVLALQSSPQDRGRVASILGPPNGRCSRWTTLRPGASRCASSPLRCSRENSSVELWGVR